MELRQLKTFQMAATTLSFTQAAVLLDYVQSSVTAQIQALEEELGLPLFDRLGRRIQLTNAGQRLLWYADRLLNLAEEAQAVVSSQSRLDGTIAVGAPESICTYRLPAVLRQFRDCFPQVQLSFRPMLDSELYQQVRSGALDVAFLLQEPLQSSGLIVERLVAEPLVIISAADHSLARLPQVTPADLKGETIFLTENGCGYRHLFERALAREGIHTVIKLEFSSVEAIKQCVMAGLGIAFLPQVAVTEQIAQGKLVALNWVEPVQVYTQMAWHKDKWVSLILSEFLNLSRQILGQRL
jgi:DNA-binding transcriptional LysR family regulator